MGSKPLFLETILNLLRGSDRLGSAAEGGASGCSDDVATDPLTSPPTSTAAVPIGRAIANTRLYVLDCLRPGDLYPARGRRRTEIALRRAQWSGDADLLEYRQVGVKNDCSASTNVRSAVNRYRNRLSALRRLYPRQRPNVPKPSRPARRNSRS
jgi:hypothetical protein